MRNFRKYGLCAVAATALLAAGCGGGSNTRPAPEPTRASTPSTPEALTGSIVNIPQTSGLVARGGEEISIEAGGMKTVGGVVFSCAGDTACTASITVAGGAVSGTWTHGEVTTALATGSIADIPPTTGMAKADSQTQTFDIAAGESKSVGGVEFGCAEDTGCSVTVTVNADGTVSGVWAGGVVTAMFIDPLDEMNPANAASVAAIMNVAFDAEAIDANPAADPPVAGSPDGVSTIAILDGLKDGGMIDGSPAAEGIGAMDISMVSVTDALDPNGPAFDTTDDTTLAANPGSTVTAAVDMDENTDDIGKDMAGAIGLEGWNHRVLHSDWGDTRTPTRDGGFETLAVVYSDMAAPGPVPFEDVEDAFAMDMLTFGEAAAVNPRPWFELNADGVVVGINTGEAAWDVPTNTITITVEDALVADITQVKTNGEQVRGTYFGAMGTFTCADQTNGCTIRRATAGDTDFTVPDLNGEDAGHGAGTWTFEPDAGETVSLPDQDWLAFGFWLTAPDDAANGLHRLGVFYDGMDPYGYEAATNTLAAGQQLNGSAKYEGSAVGYYVNGDESGLFTASSHLSANFDVEGTDNDNMLSGRIDNFKDSHGRFVGADTRTNPNDPMQGGENDWVVRLNAGAIATAGTSTGTAGGSADGVLWTGNWNAQLYGGGDRMSEAAVEEDTTAGTPAIPAVRAPAPSGVAGNFRAITGELATGGYKGVIGAFGAQLDEHTPTPAE